MSTKKAAQEAQHSIRQSHALLTLIMHAKNGKISEPVELRNGDEGGSTWVPMIDDDTLFYALQGACRLLDEADNELAGISQG